MADELLSGDTGKIRMRLAAFEREEHGGRNSAALARISSYEKSTGSALILFISLAYRTIQITSVLWSLDWLESKGFSVDRDHYQMVYTQGSGNRAKHWRIFTGGSISTTRKISGATPFRFRMVVPA